MYCKIFRVKNGERCIRYCLDGKGHDGSERRNVLVSSIGLPEKANGNSSVYIAEFAEDWKKARSNHLNRAIHIIQSFSLNELDPDDPDDWVRGNEIGLAFAKKYYPKRKVFVSTQVDGKGHKIHNHILINDCDELSGSACTSDQTSYWNVRDRINEVSKEHGIVLDNGKNKTADIYNNTREEIRERLEKNNSAASEKKIMYVDVIKDHVTKALEAATSRSEFESNLNALGVTAVFHDKKTYKRKRDTEESEAKAYYTYTLVDAPEDMEKPKNRPGGMKARSNKLGAAYDVEYIDEQLSSNYTNKFRYKDNILESKSETGDIDEALALIEPAIIPSVVAQQNIISERIREEEIEEEEFQHREDKSKVSEQRKAAKARQSERSRKVKKQEKEQHDFQGQEDRLDALKKSVSKPAKPISSSRFKQAVSDGEQLKREQIQRQLSDDEKIF